MVLVLRYGAGMIVRLVDASQHACVVEKDGLSTIHATYIRQGPIKSIRWLLALLVTVLVSYPTNCCCLYGINMLLVITTMDFFNRRVYGTCCQDEIQLLLCSCVLKTGPRCWLFYTRMLILSWFVFMYFSVFFCHSTHCICANSTRSCYHQFWSRPSDASAVW